jgi:hypothetical protein
MIPCRILIPAESPSRKLSQLSHGYASIKLEMLDSREMNATIRQPRPGSSRRTRKSPRQDESHGESVGDDGPNVLLVRRDGEVLPDHILRRLLDIASVHPVPAVSRHLASIQHVTYG